jgi:RimJ/RimL family protein N-acetyltransferase
MIRTPVRVVGSGILSGWVCTQQSRYRSPSCWGHGYATEAAAGLLDQAFTTMELDCVGCVTNAENHRSVRVAERLGMGLIAHVSVPRDDESRSIEAALYQITNLDFRLPCRATMWP